METPSTVTPTARRAVRSTTATIVPSCSNASRTGSGGSAATTTASSKDVSAQRRGSPATVPPQPLGDVLDQRPCAVDRQPARGSAWLGRESLEEARLGHGADAAHRAKPAGERGGPELVRRVDVQRPPDLEHPLRRDADEAPEADELRLHLPLQLLELGDRAGLHQLGQARGDAGADPAQLLHPAGAHELGDGRPCLPHRLGGAAVGARGVALGAGQLEQDGERLQPLGDLGVVDHARTMPGRGADVPGDR